MNTHQHKFKKKKRPSRPAKKARKACRKVTLMSREKIMKIAILAMLIKTGRLSAILLEHSKWWHGNIDQQFSNVRGLFELLTGNLSIWSVPLAIREQMGEFVPELDRLITKCRTNEGSPADRLHRDTLLKSAVAYCLMDVKTWAYDDFITGKLTADDVHEMNFLLPGDLGGHHDRVEPTDVIAETKVKIINADFIDGIVDHATDMNAGPVKHGWPRGIRQAVLLMLEADGKTEVFRKMTTHLHNEIKMPEGSHGKYFMLAAAFLKHIDDEPKFGEFTIFSMPKSNNELIAVLDQQHHDDFEARLRAVEQHRRVVEELHAEHNAQVD
jgi:hypothetical protein